MKRKEEKTKSIREEREGLTLNLQSDVHLPEVGNHRIGLCSSADVESAIIQRHFLDVEIVIDYLVARRWIKKKKSPSKITRERIKC